MIYTASSVTYTPSTAGHPTTGTWAYEALVVDSNDALWICTAAGTPGTWAEVAGGSGVSLPLTVSNGGQGGSSLAAYELVAGGITSTSPVQSIASSGSVGALLTDGGASALPSFALAIAPQVATLTDGSSVALNAVLGNDFRWTLGAGSHTLAAPSNPVNGQAITIAIKYSGSFTPLFNAVYDFGAGGQPSWTATSGKTDYVGFRYDSALNAGGGEWAYMGSVLGLTS